MRQAPHLAPCSRHRRPSPGEKTPGTLCLALVLLALLPAAAAADQAQTFIGNTSAGSAGVYTRTTFDGTSLEPGAGPVRYIAQPFKVTGAATCKILSSHDYDGVIFLYQDSFDANLPLNNFMAGNDDGPLATPHIGGSLIENQFLDGGAIPGGRTYVLVTTGYVSASVGAFQNFIQCDSSAVQPIQGSCGIYSGIPPENAICLANRFLVKIDNISNSATGVAIPVRAGSTDTALFWFYNDRNWEVMAKVVNGCLLNHRWWFFAGSLTNQQYRITVTDTHTGAQKQYNNTLGVNAPAIADTNAFATCP